MISPRYYGPTPRYGAVRFQEIKRRRHWSSSHYWPCPEIVSGDSCWAVLMYEPIYRLLLSPTVLDKIAPKCQNQQRERQGTGGIGMFVSSVDPMIDSLLLSRHHIRVSILNFHFVICAREITT
ncbi:hypothetical protein J6590_021113 [Homalodisca vitripennis]|nr:hypothetical protein J6590_021113 [Homalodisca vitripennis]